MQRLATLAMLVTAACERNPEARDFFDDVEDGSVWSMRITSLNGQPSACQAGFADKTGKVPSRAVTGCEAGCTCLFDFELEDHGDDLGPSIWHVGAWLDEWCSGVLSLSCTVEDADTHVLGTCHYTDGVTDGVRCDYRFAIARE